MNKVIYVTLCAGLLISGCGIGGFWMNGNPHLSPPEPYVRNFEKSNVTDEQRLQDWLNCGGLDDGNYAAGKILPGETSAQESRRTNHALQHCMLDKSYQFTGACYDNEIGRNSPGCAGRELTPL
jgi:hypothetical protein